MTNTCWPGRTRPLFTSSSSSTNTDAEPTFPRVVRFENHFSSGSGAPAFASSSKMRVRKNCDE